MDATERMIQEALERLQVGRTSFIIAHRLGTVRSADQILCVGGRGKSWSGAVTRKLLASGGVYARLVHAQTALPEGVPDPDQDEAPLVEICR